VTQFSLSLLVLPGQVRGVSEALRAVARRLRGDCGCASAEVYVSVENADRLVLEARWTAPEDVARFIRSDDFTNLLTLMEMATEPPVLEFRVGGGTRGLDYVAEVRGGAGPAKT
jgi:quinol monooxygenase YgiN